MRVFSSRDHRVVAHNNTQEIEMRKGAFDSALRYV